MVGQAALCIFIPGSDSQAVTQDFLEITPSFAISIASASPSFLDFVLYNIHGY
jgi:hypothetical protein